jgi:hypothetical protein
MRHTILINSSTTVVRCTDKQKQVYIGQMALSETEQW